MNYIPLTHHFGLNVFDELAYEYLHRNALIAGWDSPRIWVWSESAAMFGLKAPMNSADMDTPWDEL